jgi:hypothetical protein
MSASCVRTRFCGIQARFYLAAWEDFNLGEELILFTLGRERMHGGYVGRKCVGKNCVSVLLNKWAQVDFYDLLNVCKLRAHAVLFCGKALKLAVGLGRNSILGRN